MSWKNLLNKNETKILPWINGKSLSFKGQSWKLDKLPPETGWYEFTISSRNAAFKAPSQIKQEILFDCKKGYLIGDRIIADNVENITIKTLNKVSDKVYLLDPTLEVFSRIEVGRIDDDGPFFFKGQEMPLGPELDVLSALYDGLTSIDHIKDVTPALDLAFKMELWRKEEEKRIRLKIEEDRKKEEEKKAFEQRMNELKNSVGSAVGRRELAKVDFASAARYALSISGAEFLSRRASYNAGEEVVVFRYKGQRFECVCDQDLRIIDAGICLTDSDSGERGDTYFSLESLPLVINEAMENDVLVVLRRA